MKIKSTFLLLVTVLTATTLTVSTVGAKAEQQTGDLIASVINAVNNPDTLMEIVAILTKHFGSSSEDRPHVGALVNQISSLLLMEQPLELGSLSDDQDGGSDSKPHHEVRSSAHPGEYRYPIVQSANLDQDYISRLLGDDWGFQAKVSSDLSIGFKVPINSLFTDRDAILLNPQFYVDLAGYTEITYLAGPMHFTFKFLISLFRFIPFDQQLLLSLEPPSNPNNYIDFCYGMNYLTDVMDINIMLEVWVKECDFGLFSIFTGDFQDCYWRQYELAKPIADVHFLNALDTISDLVPYFCNYKPLKNKHQGPWGTIIKFTQ